MSKNKIYKSIDFWLMMVIFLFTLIHSIILLVDGNKNRVDILKDFINKELEYSYTDNKELFYLSISYEYSSTILDELMEYREYLNKSQFESNEYSINSINDYEEYISKFIHTNKDDLAYLKSMVNYLTYSDVLILVNPDCEDYYEICYKALLAKDYEEGIIASQKIEKWYYDNIVDISIFFAFYSLFVFIYLGIKYTIKIVRSAKELKKLRN